MAVPKATVYKNGDFARRNYNVWSPRKALKMKTVPKAQSPKASPNNKFGVRIF